VENVINPLHLYLSSFKLVEVRFRFAEFSLSCVPQISIDIQENVSICASTIDISSEYTDLVRVNCRKKRRRVFWPAELSRSLLDAEFT